LEEEANHLARESGFVQRERNLSGADFAQTLIFGWWQEPQETLDGLSQVAQRREVSISASGLCQRFTQEAASFLQRLLERLTQVHLQVEPAQLPLLSRFAAVVVEDCSSISLPDELETCFLGAGAQRAGLKLWVRWDVLTGHLQGPLLTQARQPESPSPFNEEPLPDDGLYLADLAFFSLQRLQRLAHPTEGGRGWFVMRLNQHTALYTRSGHRIELAGVVPRQEGELREMGVLLGKEARLPVRLLMLRVPEEVAEQRRERMREEARTHGRHVSEQALYLAGWTLVVTNVPTSGLSAAEVLVLLGVRWQVERLFRLWKDEGQIDEWRSKKRWRILCELYAKLAGMLIQHWLRPRGLLAGPTSQPAERRAGLATRSQSDHGGPVGRTTGADVGGGAALAAFGDPAPEAPTVSQYGPTAGRSAALYSTPPSAAGSAPRVHLALACWQGLGLLPASDTLN